MTALLEKGMHYVHTHYICTDIIHASNYSGCVDDYAILLALVYTIYSMNFRVTAVLDK